MERTGKLAIASKLNHGIDKIKGFFGKIKTFFIEVNTETRKVTWPTFKEVRDTTIVVIIAVFVFGIFLYLVDLALGGILKYLFRTVA